MIGVWAYIFELASIAFDPNINLALNAIQINNNGTRPITEILNQCSSLNLTLFNNDLFTNDVQMKFVYEQLEHVFDRDFKVKEECLNSTFSNDLTFEEFFEVALLFKQSAELSELFEGDIPLLIVYLTDYVTTNVSLFSENNGEENSIMLEEFIEKLCLYFENETHVHKRIQFTVSLIESMKDHEKQLIGQIQLEKWGQLEDLIKVNAFYTYHGFHQLMNGTKCENALNLVKINATDNSTILTNSLELATNQWTHYEKQNFQIFFDQIKRLIFVSKWTSAEKLVQIAKTIRFYESKETQMEQQLLNTQISNWGTLNELCQCVGV